MSKNHKRAKRIVESWPSWMRRVTLTKHSNKLICRLLATCGLSGCEQRRPALDDPKHNKIKVLEKQLNANFLIVAKE